MNGTRRIRRVFDDDQVDGSDLREGLGELESDMQEEIEILQRALLAVRDRLELLEGGSGLPGEGE